jgi:hypothetical protein
MKSKLLLTATAVALFAGGLAPAGNASAVAVGACESRQDCVQQITLHKVFAPHNQTPTVDLFVQHLGNGFEQHAGVVHDGGSATFKVDTGNHAIRESGTVLSDYTAEISCTGATPVRTSDFSWSYNQQFHVDVDCTITNSLKSQEGGRGGETQTPATTTPTATTPQVQLPQTGGVGAGNGAATRKPVAETLAFAGSIFTIGLGYVIRRRAING